MQRSLTRLIIPVALAAALWLGPAGCSVRDNYSPEDGPSPAYKVDTPMAPQARVQWNNVGLLDKSIAFKIAVEDTNSRRTASDTLEAWALLRNRTDYPLQVEGRVQFFDRGRSPVDGPTAWQRIFLPPQGVATYAGNTTLVSRVGYYYIEIREGR